MIQIMLIHQELKRLGLKKEDLKLDKKPLFLDPANNPIDRVSFQPKNVF